MHKDPLTCTREWQGRTILLHLSGDLTTGEIIRLAEVIHQARTELPECIILDLKNVTALDSVGFAFLKTARAFSSPSPISLLIQGLSLAVASRLELNGANLNQLRQWMEPTVVVPPAGVEHGPPEAESASDKMAHLAEKAAILVVDDEDLVLNYLSRYLQYKGYTVLEARDEATAIKLVQEHRELLALALLDYRLGPANGLELASRLAQLKPTLKVILMSGLNDRMIDTARHPMITHQLQKPFFGEILLQAIEEALAENGGES